MKWFLVVFLWVNGSYSEFSKEVIEQNNQSQCESNGRKIKSIVESTHRYTSVKYKCISIPEGK